MPKLGPLQVSIFSNTERTTYEEHKVTFKNSSAECYIASTADSSFGVKFALDDNWKDTWPSFYTNVYIDGKRCHQPLLGMVDGLELKSSHISGCYVNRNQLVPFTFAARQFFGFPPSSLAHIQLPGLLAEC
jgi:hypothetical protein